MNNNRTIQQFNNAAFAIKIFLLAAFCFIAQNSFSQQTKNPEETLTRILFLLDGSQSMNGSWENDSKIGVARRVISELADSLLNKKNIRIGLRVYGHQSTDDCKDTKLEVGFEDAKIAVQQIKNKLTEIRPKGKTPISYSLERAASDFTLEANTRNVVIIITDGQETCGGDPCAVSLALQRKGIFLRPFIIGMQLQMEMRSAFDCIGAYYNAQSVEAFVTIMKSILNRAINLTTTQVNLMDKFNKPTETDANMTFYDDFAGMVRYDFYHTINYRGNPDTLWLDPVNTYNLTVHTLPPIQKETFDLTPNQHNNINLNAPQGYLKLILQGVTVSNNINNKIKSIIKDPEDGKIINVQSFNTTEKYLTGKYDLEILTLPRKLMKSIDIAQSNTTTIQIELPGLATFMKSIGYGGIFMEEGNRLVKIYELNPMSTKETIALQPGTYKVIFRAKSTKRMSGTQEQTFQITSGTSISIKL